MQKAVQKDPIIAPKNVPDTPRPIDPELDAAAQNLIAQADVHPVDITEKGSAADVLETVLRQVAAFPLTPSQSRALSDFIAYIGADFATVALSDMTMRILVSDQHPHAVDNADIQQWIILDGHGYQMGASIESVLENTIYGTKTSATKYNALDISRVKNGQQALRIGLSSTRGENTKKIAPALLAAHLDTVRALAPTTPPQGITQIRQMIDLGTLSPAARELTRALADLGNARAHALMTAPTDTQPTQPLTAIRQDPQPAAIQQAPLSQATIHQAPLSQTPLISAVPIAVSNGTTPPVRVAPLDQAQKILGILNTPDRAATVPPAILQAAVHHITPYVQATELATVRTLVPQAPDTNMPPAATPLATSVTTTWTSAPAANDAKKPTATIATITPAQAVGPTPSTDARISAAPIGHASQAEIAAPKTAHTSTAPTVPTATTSAVPATPAPTTRDHTPSAPVAPAPDTTARIIMASAAIQTTEAAIAAPVRALEATRTTSDAPPTNPTAHEVAPPAPTPLGSFATVAPRIAPDISTAAAAQGPAPITPVVMTPAAAIETLRTIVQTTPTKIADSFIAPPHSTQPRVTSDAPIDLKMNPSPQVTSGPGPKPGPTVTPSSPPSPVTNNAPPTPPAPVLKVVPPVAPPSVPVRPIQPTEPILRAPPAPQPKDPTPKPLTATFKSSCGIEGCDGGENCPVRALGRAKEEEKKKIPEIKPAFHAACTDENCTQCVPQAQKKAVFKKKKQAEMAIT